MLYKGRVNPFISWKDCSKKSIVHRTEYVNLLIFLYLNSALVKVPKVLETEVYLQVLKNHMACVNSLPMEPEVTSVSMDH